MPRAGLTVEVVVTAAAALADEVGLDRLTLAALAERLGVRVPSLYKHVDGLDALRGRIAVRAKLELAERMSAAAVGLAGAQAVQAVALAYRRFAREHPGGYAATLRAPDPGDAEDLRASRVAVDVVGRALAAYHLADDDLVDAIRALRAGLHGFVALELAGGFGLPADVDRSFRRTVAALADSLSRWGSPAELA